MRNFRTIIAGSFLAGVLAIGLAPGGTLAASGSLARYSSHARAAAPAQSPPPQYEFHTIDNPADKTFNQLLGINDSNVIAGYYGSGAAGHPNRGYTLYWPYTHSNFTSENFPKAAQTQAIGINNAGITVGFYADAAGDNFGFTDVKGSFKSVVAPKTPKKTKASTVVNQLLGVNNKNVAAGFYTDAKGNAHAYSYDLKNKSFHAVTPPGATAATATGINDHGDVSGFLTKKNGDTASFLEQGRTLHGVRIPRLYQHNSIRPQQQRCCSRLNP